MGIIKNKFWAFCRKISPLVLNAPYHLCWEQSVADWLSFVLFLFALDKKYACLFTIPIPGVTGPQVSAAVSIHQSPMTQNTPGLPQAPQQAQVNPQQQVSNPGVGGSVSMESVTPGSQLPGIPAGRARTTAVCSSAYYFFNF